MIQEVHDITRSPVPWVTREEHCSENAHYYSFLLLLPGFLLLIYSFTISERDALFYNSFFLASLGLISTGIIYLLYVFYTFHDNKVDWVTSIPGDEETYQDVVMRVDSLINATVYDFEKEEKEGKRRSRDYELKYDSGNTVHLKIFLGKKRSKVQIEIRDIKLHDYEHAMKLSQDIPNALDSIECKNDISTTKK
ncbi:MAG: hypothetical protein R6U61_07265 [Thermoplasmata archaeon]